jgi:mRNA interferase YafO
MVKKRLEVDFHPETQDLFDEVELAHPGLQENLRADFALLMESNWDYRPKRFGKVDQYTWPPSIVSSMLMHIHICMPPLDDFPRNIPVSRMTCKRGDGLRDAALVYVQGEMFEERYCILALLYPHAHRRARTERLMIKLGRLAREFRERN